MQRIYKKVIVLCVIALSNPTISEDHYEQHKANHENLHGAHVHGIAELHIVLEANILLLELHSPAMNLLGFEHHANSPKQQTVVENARIKLADANTIFHINGGACHLKEQATDFSTVLRAQKNHEENDDHHEYKQHNNTHSNIEAHYQYSCVQSSKFHSIKVGLHEIFPRIESLQVQWIVNGRQGDVTLNDDIQVIYFR